jgi:hypothetical protein
MRFHNTMFPFFLFGCGLLIWYKYDMLIGASPGDSTLSNLLNQVKTPFFWMHLLMLYAQNWIKRCNISELWYKFDSFHISLVLLSFLCLSFFIISFLSLSLSRFHISGPLNNYYSFDMLAGSQVNMFHRVSVQKSEKSDERSVFILQAKFIILVP